jgi:hypothetical protein
VLGFDASVGAGVPEGDPDGLDVGEVLGAGVGEGAWFSKVYAPIDEAQIITARITAREMTRVLFIKMHLLCAIYLG